MRRRTFLAGSAGLGIGLSLPRLAYADPQSIPNGPWLNPGQTVQKAALTENVDLGPKLEQIAARSKGRMELEVAGHSAGGWPIHLARFGAPGGGRTGSIGSKTASGSFASYGITPACSRSAIGRFVRTDSSGMASPPT